jgi:hypothetical protein
MDRYKHLYGFIEKQAPQKALCLGPDPPPGEKSKFIEKTRFFMILGPSIEPEKASVKSASTANPPQKPVFIAILSIFAFFGVGVFLGFSDCMLLGLCFPRVFRF